MDQPEYFVHEARLQWSTYHTSSLRRSLKTTALRP